jgi:hypothetical protein
VQQLNSSLAAEPSVFRGFCRGGFLLDALPPAAGFKAA